MKGKLSKYLDIIIESINYLVITYALSNMAMMFQRNLFYILFFTSELWVTATFWKKLDYLTGNKVLSIILLAVCFGIQIALLYFVGRVVGEIVPFRSAICPNAWGEKNKKRTASAVGIMQHHNHGCGRKEIACKAISFVLYYLSIWEWMGAGVPSGLQNQ